VLARTFASGDIVFSFGGIGATPDDHTPVRGAAWRAAAPASRRRPDHARFRRETTPRA
jgi:molybdopterin-biosynthesis enzyme MoeA-like protein